MQSRLFPNPGRSSGGHVPSRSASLARLCLGGSLVLSLAATASTWSGGSFQDDLWSTAGNWVDGAVPADGADVVFDGEQQVANTNDLDTDFEVGTPAAVLLNSVTFAGTAGPFYLAGGALDLGGKTITNLSPNLQAFGMPIQIDEDLAGGLVVDAAAGDVEINSLGLRNGFNEFLDKTGPQTLFLNGPLIGGDTFHGRVLEGTMVASHGGNLFFNTTVSAGATLRTGGASANGIIHNGGLVTLDGTLDLAAGVNEDAGNLTGSGTVTNQGAVGTTSTLALRSSSNNTFAGSIQDGPDGGATSLRVGLAATSGSVFTAAGKLTLTGAHTYTGDTVIGQNSGLVSLELSSTGSLTFQPRTDGEGGGIVGLFPQAAGTVVLDGTFHLDLTEAEMVHNNSWTLVDAANLNESYGGNFNVAAPFAEGPPGVWTHTDGSANTWTFSEATGVLIFQEPEGRPPVTTWDGGGTGDLWSDAANWDVEVLSGDDLVFTGSTGLGNTNDLDTGWDPVNAVPGTVAIDSLVFPAGAGAFTIGGNEIYYDNRTILNESPATQTINCPIRATDGFTVDTSAGDVVLGGGLGTTAGFNKPITKTGSGKLVLNGGQTTSWALNVNAGTLQVFNPNTAGQVAGYSATIAAGATLMAESGDVFHPGSKVQVNGILDLGASEQLGVIYGGGVVTNHGDGSGVTTLLMNAHGEGDGYTWAGSIQDGGNVTAVGIEGSAGRTVLFSGANHYTGDTTILQPTESFTLASTGSLKIKPGANGAGNRIAATGEQTGATVLDGKLVLDLSGAETADGNSWTIVDAANLNETYGATFELRNAAYVPPTSYTVNAGNGTFDAFGEDDSHVAGGGNFGNSNTIDVSGVSDPAPAGVYQSERYGNSTYTFPDLGAGAGYTVRLHFAELFWGGTGQRVFDVLINGVTVLDNYDIVAAAGSNNKAVVQEIPVTAALDGTITIQFVTVADNAKVSGIEILPSGAGSGANFTESADVWTMVDGTNTWTFSEATGVLSLAVGAGGSNYATWASAKGIPGEPASGDFDKDGLSNLMEYALGLDPAASSMPAGTYAGGAVSFAKGADAVANGDVTWAIEESDDLGVADPWETVTPAVDDDSAISYTLPAGKPQVFVRLVVEEQ